MPKCFRCDHTYELEPESGFCPRCGWGGGPMLPEDEERYILLIGLIYRAKESGERLDRFFFRLPGSDRELAILEHGDQTEIDEAKWRITARNLESRVFVLKGVQFRRPYEFAHDEPADQLVEELAHWRAGWMGYSYLIRLLQEGDLESYLNLHEKEKREIRERESEI